MTPAGLFARLRGPRHGRGFTLVELMVTLAIAALLAAIAVPSMREFIARKRVEGVAQELVTDLRYLKSQQVQRNEPVVIRFGSTASTTCYILYTLGSQRGDCDCTRTGQPVCTQGVTGPSEELKTVILPRSRGVTVTSAPTMLVLGGFNGLPLGGVTIRAAVASTVGGEVRVSTNAAMRSDLCSVSGHESALAACPP